MRDLRIEGLLTEMGLPWEYRAEVLLHAIDPTPRWQTRLGNKIDPGTVETYKVLYQRGVEFPAIVLVRNADGTYSVLGGHHRLRAAAQAAKRTLDAYLVDVPQEEERDQVARSLNAVEAVQGQPVAERIENAKYFVQRHGWTAARAGAHFGLSHSMIGRALRADVTRSRLRAMDVPVPLLSDLSLAELYALDNDPVLAASARLVHEAHLRPSAVTDLTREVRQARSEAEQLAVVTRWRQFPAVRQAMTRGGRVNGRANGRPAPSPPAARFASYIKGLRRLVLRPKVCTELQLAVRNGHAELCTEWDMLDAQVRAALWD